MIIDRIENLADELGVRTECSQAELRGVGYQQSKASFLLKLIEGELGLNGTGFTLEQRLARCRFMHLDREEELA